VPGNVVEENRAAENGCASRSRNHHAPLPFGVRSGDFPRLGALVGWRWRFQGPAMDRRAGEEVTPVSLEGAQAWILTTDVRELPPLRLVCLLPGFDQYVGAASCHAQHLLPGDLRPRVYRPQGWISPVLLANGRMQGTWRPAT